MQRKCLVYSEGTLQALQHASVAAVLALDDAIGCLALRRARLAKETTQTIMPQHFVQECLSEFEPFCEVILGKSIQ